MKDITLTIGALVFIIIVCWVIKTPQKLISRNDFLIIMTPTDTIIYEVEESPKGEYFGKVIPYDDICILCDEVKITIQ